MNSAESLLMAYLLNSLWQVPLIACAAWIAAQVMRPVGPGAEHRVWVASLLGQAMLPAVSMLPWERVHMSWPWRMHAQQTLQGSVMVQMGSGLASDGLRFPGAAIATVIGLYAAVTLYFAARFVWRWLRLRELQRSTEPVVLIGNTEDAWHRGLHEFGVVKVALVSSRRIFAPLTMGFTKRCVMLPAEMLADFPGTELETVIGHELAHVKRRDFVKNLGYELLSMTVNYHPGVWFVRQRLTESREMVCDAMAARVSGSNEYAKSLLKLAGLLLKGKSIGVPYAIGVFDSSTLERRLMKLTEMNKEIGRVRRCIALGACVVLGVAAATSAVALRIGVDDNGTAAAQNETVRAIDVKAEIMQDQLLTKSTPVYPPDGKKKRVQGKVVLKAEIGKDGHVESLHVVSGPSELQQSAMDAVRQWVYKPFLLNGNPVNVITKITVQYTLAK